jgi:signal transduction histidine kinase
MDAETSGARPDLPDMRSRAAPIIERAPLSMVEVEGGNHVVCFVNAAFCQLVQRKPGELIGRRFGEIVANGDVCVPLLDKVYQTGEFAAKVVMDDSAPDTVYWMYAMWPALDADAKPERVIIQMTRSFNLHQNIAAMNEALLIGAVRQYELREEVEQANARLLEEVAERNEVAESLRATKAELRVHAESLEQTVAERTAQLSASVGELEAFSYSLVHDLRAPIRAIHGFTEMVLEMPREEIGPGAVELLHRVVKAAVRMDSLIQDVLSLSQVIRLPTKREAVDVDTLVRDLVKERPELAPPRAEITIDGPLLPMRGHEAILSQCLTNLLSNAVKFVRPGELPKVRVWSEERAVAVDCVALASYAGSAPAQPRTEPVVVRLWIEDQGIGITSEAHKTIFEIFQRLHTATLYEGSGIGLAIVRKGMERMGGGVGVESTPGKGSRFWLELPKA